MASLLIALWTCAAHAETVDRIVSTVGDRIITLSDVRFEESLAVLDRSPIRVFEEGGDALSRLEDYRVLRTLAGEVRLFRPKAYEVESRLNALRDDFTLYTRLLQSSGMDDAQLKGQLTTRMVVERYVQHNLGYALEDASLERWWQAYEAFMAPLRAAAGVRRIPG